MKKQTAAQLLISSAQMSADIRYLCGTEPPEAALLIKTGRNITLIISEMEYSRMKRAVKTGVRVVYPEQIGSTWKAGAGDWIKKTSGASRLTVPYAFPAGLVEKLRTGKYTVEIQTAPICPQREIKTADEITAIQNSQRAAVAAMNTAVNLIHTAIPDNNGILKIGGKILTAKTVRWEIIQILLDRDCTANDTIVAGGKQSADPHERGDGPLYAGTPIVIDIFPRSIKTGYWGDITRTVCRGPAAPELKKLYNAVRAAQTIALNAVCAGAWTDDMHNAAAKEMQRRGYKTGAVNGTPQGFIHGLGHGVGLEIHEAPRVSSAVHQKLRAGQIITIEPGLYYPGLGGVRIEDTVLVTQTGCKILAACPKKFELMG
ncbi:MAG: Xaa-Pro peptidase family protein [Kiritimatiellales bacterium]